MHSWHDLLMTLELLDTNFEKSLTVCSQGGGSCVVRHAGMCIYIFDEMESKVSLQRHCTVLFINICSTVGSFPLIYNNKKAILKLDGEGIDLGLVKYQLRIQPHLAEPADRTLASHEVHVWVCACTSAGRWTVKDLSTTSSIRLSNKSRIMGIR